MDDAQPRKIVDPVEQVRRRDATRPPEFLGFPEKFLEKVIWILHTELDCVNVRRQRRMRSDRVREIRKERRFNGSSKRRRRIVSDKQFGVRLQRHCEALTLSINFAAIAVKVANASICSVGVAPSTSQMGLPSRCDPGASLP